MSYDIDFRSRLRISNLCGFLQDAAGNHAEHLGLGYQSMMGSGRAWMLSRLYVSIHECPVWNDEITVETWPAGMERLFFRRDFQAFRKNQKMISAVSYWLALDKRSLRPQVFPIDEEVVRSNSGRFALEGPMETIPRIPSVAAGNGMSRLIRYSELDQNRHVNNTRYVEWIMDQFETRMLEQSLPNYFAIDYRHEVKEDDTVTIRHAPYPQDPHTTLLHGRLAVSGQICFRAKVRF